MMPYGKGTQKSQNNTEAFAQETAQQKTQKFK